MTATKTLLIVDDNRELRELIKMTLSFSDYELHEAENAMEALDLVEAIKPDVVLLDIMMPGQMNGLDICEIIKKKSGLNGVRVIIISAMNQQEDLKAANTAGADAYFIKPFSPLRLLESIKNKANNFMH